eukprot:sb/3464816/
MVISPFFPQQVMATRSRTTTVRDVPVQTLFQSLPSLPYHWMKNVFYVELCQDMYYANDALAFIQVGFCDKPIRTRYLGHVTGYQPICYQPIRDQYFLIRSVPARTLLGTALQDMGLEDNPYLLSKRAEVHYTLREYEIARDRFKELLDKDPNRLDIVDMYSNILYVKEDKANLNHLAHHCIEVDKYRPETCFVVGNFYSIFGKHEKSIIYFQRALRLDPEYLSAWTLMGHEYVELKNYNMAIECYRNALDINPRDYRSWYLIGQTYELLKMHAYSLYYYMEAQRLRPTDSRMTVALGATYEKLEQPMKAKKCFLRAMNVGDQEDIAMIRLARVCEALHDEQAAVRLSEADVFAHKCCEFKETKNDGKALVRQIAAHRNTGVFQQQQQRPTKSNIRVNLMAMAGVTPSPAGGASSSSNKRSRTPPPPDTPSDNDMSF